MWYIIIIVISLVQTSIKTHVQLVSAAIDQARPMSCDQAWPGSCD